MAPFFETAYAISGNGSNVVGRGYNKQNLRYEAFSARTTPICSPTTCLAHGKNCGTILDGCGGTLTCGACTAPQICAGGGIANVCGLGTLSSETLNPTSVVAGAPSTGTVTLGLAVNVSTTGRASLSARRSR